MIIAMERKKSGKVIKRLEKERDAKLNYQNIIVPNAKKVFKKKFPWEHGVDYKAAILYGQGPLPEVKVKMGQHKDVLKEIYKNQFLGKSRGLSREELYHTRAAETKLELMKSGELVDHTETAIWNGALNTQINFLRTKMRNIPFNQQLKVHRCMSSTHHDFPLSANQKRKVANVWLGTEVQSDDDDDDDNGSIDEEESLMELLSDDDDDDRVGDGNGGDNNTTAKRKKKATTTAKTTTKKKKKATSNDSDDNINSNDDDSLFREEDSIASKDSLNLYDGPTDDEEEEQEDGARVRTTTRKKKTNTNTNTNIRPTRTCTRTPIIDGEDDEKEDDQSSRSESSSKSSDTRTVNRRTGTRRTRTRRGVPAVVEATTGSIIADYQKKKEESDEQAAFEKELSKMWLKKAKKKLEEGGTLSIPFLKALIKSKGSDPPEGSRRAPFEAAWNKVKDDADWERKVFFNERDKKELELLEGDNSEDEE